MSEALLTAQKRTIYSAGDAERSGFSYFCNFDEIEDVAPCPGQRLLSLQESGYSGFGRMIQEMNRAGMGKLAEELKQIWQG